MLNKDLYDEEINQSSYNESLDLVSEDNTENLPAKALDVASKTYSDLDELPPVTAEAVKFRLSIFNNEAGIRSIVDDDKQVWFVADDVCKFLGYKNTSAAISAHCNKVTDSKDLCDDVELARKVVLKDNNNHSQSLIAINEGDLYRLICRSRMPKARAFEKWVMEDVLPSIRKTGKYKVSRKITLSDPQAQDDYEKALAAQSEQCEIFPSMAPSVKLPSDVTERMNKVKSKLFSEGHTFATNKDFLKFIIAKGLEDLEG